MDPYRAAWLVPVTFYAILLCGATANMLADDRISTFDSEITIAKDRTLRIDEKFEITNDNGFFDSGFHRQLRIKQPGAQRAKAGLFQDIRAKVDGSHAAVSTTQNQESLDIAISIPPTAGAPGKHVIELSYAAKNQFLVYDDFEDLNQNISGEWPIPIDRASVELSFPSGIPRDTSITADTGSGTQFRFDCIRTNLPSGVRFETTQDILPNERLFLSARFSQRGYFVSNVDEEGFRAVLENHPLLYPWLAFLAGFVIFTTSGFLVAPMVVKVSGMAWSSVTGHRLAMIVSCVATMLAGVSAVFLRHPYSAMPGFILGAMASILVSGNPHGGDPFSLITVAMASNFAFYYLVARGLRKVWPHRQL